MASRVDCLVVCPDRMGGRAMITTGKRTAIQARHIATVDKWSKHFGITSPGVVVRIRNGRPNTATYRRGRKTIYIPPTASDDLLAHEYAHHLAYTTNLGRNHGIGFRIALVQVATVAYGQAKLYPWKGEYKNVKKWAIRNRLLEGDQP